MLTNQEKNYIRDLAWQIKERADSTTEKKKVQVFKNINSLEVEVPPVIMHMPPSAFKEIFPSKGLCICDDLFRDLEYNFKCQLIRNEILYDDLPVNNTIYSGLFYRVTDWMEGYKSVKIGPNNEFSHFEPCIKEYSDLKKMRYPELIIDWRNTNEKYNLINEVLGDILPVKKGYPFAMTCGWGESMIDQLVEMRGLEQILYDLVDAPDFVHEAMEFMTKGKLDLLEQYKQQNALYLNNEHCLIGSCSYAFSDELPGIEYNPEKVEEKNLWSFAQAQEFSEVSPEMLGEFVLPYQARILNKFGLSSYGCCEPMDCKIDTIEEHINNLRILSISPFTNHEIAAEKCKGKYVMACKVHPVLFVCNNDEYVTNYMIKLVKALRGCSATISFAEILDYGNDSSKMIKFVRIAKKIIDRYWE